MLCNRVKLSLAVTILSYGIAGAPHAAAQANNPAEQANQAVIKRQPIVLVNPREFQIPIQLEPSKSLQLISSRDGVVRKISVKPGDEVQAQTEVIRLENLEERLMLDKATALYKAAQIKLKQAEGENAKELAEAMFDAAKADLDLAKYRYDNSRIHVPFRGKIYRIHAEEGEFIRAGQPLVDFGDPAKLKAEIPLDRADAKTGEETDIRVESQDLKAKIVNVLPLAKRFQSLREIAPSVVSAIVEIDNSDKKLMAGQAVYPAIVPRYFLAEIPSSAIANQKSKEGGRKVQVIRNNIIRDVNVTPLGQIGQKTLYVSGPFAEGDVLITSSSVALLDGTEVRVSAPPTSGAGNQPNRPRIGNPSED